MAEQMHAGIALHHFCRHADACRQKWCSNGVEVDPALLHRRQQLPDWVRVGLAKQLFVEQLVAPLAAWAWEGSNTVLDMRRFNFGPEQGSMVTPCLVKHLYMT